MTKALFRIVLLIVSGMTLLSSALLAVRSSLPSWVLLILTIILTSMDFLILWRVSRKKNRLGYSEFGIWIIGFFSVYIPWIAQFAYNLNRQHLSDLVVALAGCLFILLLVLITAGRLWALSHLISLQGDTGDTP